MVAVNHSPSFTAKIEKLADSCWRSRVCRVRQRPGHGAVRVCTGSDPASSAVQVPFSAKLWDANCANQLMATFSIVTLFPWELLSSITASYTHKQQRDQDEHGLMHKRHLHFVEGPSLCMWVQLWFRLLLDLSESSQEVTNLERNSWKGSKVKPCFLRKEIRINQEELNTSECSSRKFLQTWGP